MTFKYTNADVTCLGSKPFLFCCLVFILQLCACGESSVNESPDGAVEPACIEGKRKCTDEWIVQCISENWVDLFDCSGLTQSCVMSLDGGVGCSGNGSGDADTDSDTDGDSDQDIDTDGIPDAGPWDWIDFPEGEDCGAGCKQVSFSKEIADGEWDVWGNYLSYSDEESRIWAVDISRQKSLQLPNIHPQFPIGIGKGSYTFWPTIFEKTICYTHNVWRTPHNFMNIICANLETEYQQVISYINQTAFDLHPARYSDLNANHFISEWGCGNYEYGHLCHIPVSDPNPKPEKILDRVDGSISYGDYNSLWGDIVVWQKDGYDILGYNLATKEFFTVSADSDVYEMNPRINGTKVVYQDFRYSHKPSLTNWNHSAVYMYDIETQQHTEITDGQWIGSSPDIFDNIVIWLDYRNCANPNDVKSFDKIEIWGKNIQTGKEFQITNLPGRPKMTPRIFGDKVFVHMQSLSGGSSGNIYMFDLPPEAR